MLNGKRPGEIFPDLATGTFELPEPAGGLPILLQRPGFHQAVRELIQAEFLPAAERFAPLPFPELDAVVIGWRPPDVGDRQALQNASAFETECRGQRVRPAFQRPIPQLYPLSSGLGRGGYGRGVGKFLPE